MSKNQLIIILDSSVSQKNNEGVGAALCLWTAYPYNPSEDNHPLSKKLSESDRYQSGVLMEAAPVKSLRCGSIYNSTDGPTKIFYDGIIRALQSCFYLLKKEGINEVLVLGDCEHAIKQLNGQVGVKQMQPLYKQVKKLEGDFKQNGVKEIKYIYIKEQDYSLYKKIDGMAKEMRERITKIFNNH
jgi:hypothetical protein